MRKLQAQKGQKRKYDAKADRYREHGEHDAAIVKADTPSVRSVLTLTQPLSGKLAVIEV